MNHSANHTMGALKQDAKGDLIDFQWGYEWVLVLYIRVCIFVHTVGTWTNNNGFLQFHYHLILYNNITI